MLAYLPEKEAVLAVARLGFNTVHFYNRDGAQAYSFISDTDHVIACRGTEPNEWNDVRADLDASTALAETIGRVHRGFKREVDDLWPVLEQALQRNSRDAMVYRPFSGWCHGDHLCRPMPAVTHRFQP